MERGWIRAVAGVCVVCVGLSIPLEASIVKGKRAYGKYLKSACGFKGDLMGSKHTQYEWDAFYKSNTLAAELLRICPESTPITKEKDLKYLYRFFRNFASDSGNVPSCN